MHHHRQLNDPRALAFLRGEVNRDAPTHHRHLLEYYQRTHRYELAVLLLYDLAFDKVIHQ